MTIGGGIILFSGLYYLVYGFEYERPLQTISNTTRSFTYDAWNRTQTISETSNVTQLYENIRFKPQYYTEAIGLALVFFGLVNFAYAYLIQRKRD